MEKCDEETDIFSNIAHIYSFISFYKMTDIQQDKYITFIPSNI
jgi:hypothetical protein